MIAINLSDWFKNKDNICLEILLKPVVDTQSRIECEPDRADGIGLPLVCENDRAEAIAEIIRMKFKRHEFRIYSGDKKSWKRI